MLKTHNILTLRKKLFMDTKDTNVELLKVAAMSLSMVGFQHATMAQIAGSVGMSRVQLEKLYPTKVDLKHAIYELFKSVHLKSQPDVAKILANIKDKHPYETLMSLNYDVPSEFDDFTVNTLIMAIQIFKNDKESLELVEDFSIGYAAMGIKAVLDELIRLNRIEPMDTKVCAKIASYCLFSSTVLDKKMPGTKDESWNANLKFLCQLIKVKD